MQILGRARILRARDDIHAVGHAVVCRMLGLDRGTRLDPPVADEVARQAQKRVAIEVEVQRLRSWDHRKLAGAPGQATR